MKHFQDSRVIFCHGFYPGSNPQPRMPVTSFSREILKKRSLSTATGFGVDANSSMRWTSPWTWQVFVTFLGWWKHDPFQWWIVTPKDRGWKGRHLERTFWWRFWILRAGFSRTETWDSNQKFQHRIRTLAQKLSQTPSILEGIMIRRNISKHRNKNTRVQISIYLLITII